MGKAKRKWPNVYETKQLLNKGKKSQSAMRIDIPTKVAVDSAQPPARFVILARGVTLKYVEVESGPGMSFVPGVAMSGGKVGAPMMMSTAGGKSKQVGLTLRYMIWDYQKDVPVAYGKYQGTMNAGFFFNQTDWLGLMESAAKALIGNCPLP